MNPINTIIGQLLMQVWNNMWVLLEEASVGGISPGHRTREVVYRVGYSVYAHAITNILREKTL